MSIIAACVVPHPPMIIPAVGRGSEKQIEETTRAYERAADFIASAAPDTIIISSPHSILYSDYFHVSPGQNAKGDFSAFGAGSVSFSEKYDTELVREICRLASDEEFPAGILGEKEKKLDHGTMVPLYFIEKKYTAFSLVRISLSGLSLPDHYHFGQIIHKAVEQTGRRAVFVASGDLSHKLQPYGPYGFSPEGPRYDERIMEVLSRGAFGDLMSFDDTFCEKAAECGHRSFVIMAGALDGVTVRAEKLSHQDVTGVGYGVCLFTPEGGDERRRFLDAYLKKQAAQLAEKRSKEDAFVRLARESLETYVKTGRPLALPSWVPEDMRQRKAGVFVSLHKDGMLRGCIGTTQPTQKCIALEIIMNAVSAAARDPRFSPVTERELDRIEIGVDELMVPEKISSPDELDVKKYGVIVTRGARRGLLLPDLDGVDDVNKQIDIARRKAGIGKDENIALERFEVIRHA